MNIENWSRRNILQILSAAVGLWVMKRVTKMGYDI